MESGTQGWVGLGVVDKGLSYRGFGARPPAEGRANEDHLGLLYDIFEDKHNNKSEEKR